MRKIRYLVLFYFVLFYLGFYFFTALLCRGCWQGGVLNPFFMAFVLATAVTYMVFLAIHWPLIKKADERNDRFRNDIKAELESLREELLDTEQKVQQVNRIVMKKYNRKTKLKCRERESAARKARR